jgi:hypothetical protein
MIWVGHLKKLLKVISRLSRRALEIALDSGDGFLTGVIGLLVVDIFITTSGNYDPLGALLWPPPTTFGAPLSAFANSLGRCPLGATRDRLSVTLDKNDSDCLLTRGMSSGDVE